MSVSSPATTNLADAMADFEKSLTPEVAAKLATSAMRLSLAAYAYLQAKDGELPAAAALLNLSEHLAPIRQQPAAAA